MPRFEFDPAKSEANLAKHGIDFDEATEIWTDSRLFEAPIRREGESRFLVVGMTRGKVWSAIITYRGQAIRIISVRRARAYETRRYYEESQKEIDG